MKTMKVSELIRKLNIILSISGDLPVLLSSDEEGNSYGTIADESFDVCSNKVFIYPWEERIDI